MDVLHMLAQKNVWIPEFKSKPQHSYSVSAVQKMNCAGKPGFAKRHPQHLETVILQK